MKKLLTEKEVELLEAYFKTGSQVKAYMTVYPDKKPSQAHGHAHEKINKCLAKLNQREIYEFANLGIGRVYAKLEELLECNTTTYTKEGVVCGVDPDNSNRMKALAQLIKLLKLDTPDAAPTTSQGGIAPIAVNVNRNINICPALLGEDVTESENAENDD